MKKVFAVFLVAILSLSLFACGGTPIEKANRYVEKLDADFEDNCSWRAQIERSGSEQAYVVEVRLPYYSDSISSSSSVQNSEHGGVIETILEYELKQEVEGIAKKVYSKLEAIFEKEESIDRILILFEYFDGELYQYFYQDGALENLNDYLK